MTKRALRIAVVSNTAWYISNFRLNLMRRLQEEGHTVIAIAPRDAYAEKIEAAGMPFRHVPISGRGVNPFAELATVARLGAQFRREQVDVVLSYTPKGNIYSGLACWLLGANFVPNVSGLGTAFIRRSAVTRVMLALYRLTFRRAQHVFFQNLDDMKIFVEGGLVKRQQAERVPGSGVDLTRFRPPETPAADPSHEGPLFLLVARMLWDKGVGEFVAASKAVKAQVPGARFALLGAVSPGNPSAIPQDQLDAWVAEGVVTYLGATDDVRPYIAAADCVVLPSYREGVPRVLLEAAAMAKPVITTDAPGCRDAVVDGVTGFLCRPADATDLAAKMAHFLGMATEERLAAGQRGRAFVESTFDERIVLDRYLHVVAKIAAAAAPNEPGRVLQPARGDNDLQSTAVQR